MAVPVQADSQRPNGLSGLLGQDMFHMQSPEAKARLVLLPHMASLGDGA